MAGEVPQYDPQATPRPVGTPYDDTHVSPLSFGAGLGQGLEELGAAGAELAAHAKHNADIVAVQGATATSRKAFNDLILDPEKGYASTKGADAMALRQKYADQFDKAVKDAASGLTNPAQQRMFAMHALQVRRQAALRMASHESQQQDAYAAAQFKGNFDAELTTLEHSIGDPGEVAASVDRLTQIGIDAAKHRYGASASKEAIASVVLPELQKAAYGGMQTAIGTQDPEIARGALDKLGPYLITGHHRDFSKAVEAMETKQQVAQSSGEIMGGAAKSVAVPGGPAVARVDAVKVAAGLAAIEPTDPHAADIQKAVEQQQQRLEKVWDATVSQVQDRVWTAGQDPATGAFDINSPKISAADKTWLNEHAPKALTALRGQDAKTQRQNSAEEKAAARAASSANYSAAAEWVHDEANKAEVLGMTRAQFGSRLLDDKEFPGGLTPEARTKALAEFDKVQKAGTKLEEPAPKTVTDAIRKAANGNSTLEKKLRDQFYGDLLDKANAAYASNKTIGTDKLREYVEAELAKGSVTGAGMVFGDRNGVRRLEWERSNEFGWKPFVTTNGETLPGHSVKMTKEGKTRIVQPDQVEAVLKQGAAFAK